MFTDGNQDWVIDEHDDAGAYLADIDGRNLRRITPANSRVLDKSYDKKRNVLTMRILKDAIGDGSLDAQYDHALIEASVSERKLLGEVLNKGLLREFMNPAEPRRKGQGQAGSS